ncbi:hypothetical protein T265_00265 [Opisthorchis viverrini]|uniref:Reverse transcriptase domain-containing protein n=1 Tax=Opisthorchis viverrini TaxID=6198 RepID=A0A075A316_OPIVI|nr:hypothetical protein T265_00265 [Opisthorchis viverrini]KER34093.1 hypothetical protein T265_00265 [Opisthorchis viverrini]
MNVRSLLSKQDDLRQWVSDVNPDILGVAETWLDLTVLDQEIKLPGYEHFRCDRQQRLHGGVLLYVKSDIRCRLQNTYLSNDCYCEQIWCEIITTKGNFHVGVLYRSPANISSDWITRAKNNLCARNVLLMGDFNFPRVNWSSYTALPGCTDLETTFLNTVLEMGLIQHVHQPTRSLPYQIPSCLDLLFTQAEQRLDYLSVSEPLGTSDHMTLFAYLRLPHHRTPPRLPQRNVWKTDFDALLIAANSMDWTLPTEGSVDTCWLSLKDKISWLCDLYTPVRHCKSNRCRPPWFDRELVTLTKRRRKLWNRYRQSRDPVDYATYKQQRNSCNFTKLRKRQAYENSLAESAKTTPKRIFAYVNRNLKSSDELPYIQDQDGNTITSDSARATEFACHFSSVYATNPSRDSLTGSCAVRLDSLVCCTEKVCSLLLSLNTAKSAGPDDLHPVILKTLAPVIAPAVTTLYNKSLAEGVLPQEWKDSVVRPFPKGGDLSRVTNYRPICLTPILAKVLEKIVKQALLHMLDEFQILTPAQHGFLRGRSCVTNMLTARHHWLAAVDAGHAVDVIFVDFSKAFDRVDHTELIKKLQGYGIGGDLLRWLKSFLHDRRWKVRVNDHCTDWYTSPSGVPQGTVLGPVLFLLHVNDLPGVLQSASLLFADDLKIWKPIECDEDRVALQHDLERLVAWSSERRLPINPAKSEYICLGKPTSDRVYHLNGQKLKSVSSIRDLGVQIRYDLKSKDHTSAVYKKSLRILWTLKRSFSMWTEELVLKLYPTMIRPILEYGAPAFSPLTKDEARKLERVQHLVTKMVPSLRSLSYSERCRKLKLFTLEYRRLRIDLIYVFRVLCLNHFPQLMFLFDIPTTNITRGHRFKLTVTRMDNVPHGYSFSRRVVILEFVQSETVQIFKRNLDEHLSDLCFCEDISSALVPKVSYSTNGPRAYME